MMSYMAGEQIEVELVITPGCPNATATRDMLRAALLAADLAATPIRVSVVRTQREAESRGFVGSPTILINGVDPFAEAGRPAGLACRLYRDSAGVTGLPSAEQLPSVDQLREELIRTFDRKRSG